MKNLFGFVACFLTGAGMANAGYGLDTIEWWCAVLVVVILSRVNIG